MQVLAVRRPAGACRSGDIRYIIQMEIAQRSYMNEVTLSYDERLSKKLTPILKLMLDTFIVNSEEYFKDRRYEEN